MTTPKTPLRAALAIVALLALTTQVARAADLKDFEAREYKDADGNALLYRIYKPKGYDATKRYPLVLFLHGAGERGNNNTAQVRDALYWARDAVQKDHPCFVVAPQVPAKRQAFQLYGTNKDFDASYADYADKAGQWKSYSIAAAKLPGGLKSHLMLVNADKKGGTATGEFRNLKIVEQDGPATSIDFRKLDFSKKEGQGGKVTVSDDGSTVTLTGDVRVKAPFEYKVTPKTLIEFEFRSTAQGLTHAIALDADDFLDARWANMDWFAPKGVFPKTPSTPMRLTLEMLAGLKKEFSLDDKRLYVTGLSMGGYGTWDVIARHPKLFAAAAPVCGGGDEATATIIKDIPIWCFHGGADNVVKPERSRNMIAAIKAAGGNPKYTEYPGVGHDSWNKAYSEPELVKWMFEQKLP
jgi:poly(3-hydroxybutyrate) depolymerase